MSDQFNRIVMNRQELEQFTKDPSHHGVNAQNIFESFMQYQSICRDPLLVFRYMQEKVVCTFMVGYWLNKASLYSEFGDYASCFQSLEMAKSITEEEEKSTLEVIEQSSLAFTTKMVEEMQKYHVSGKRSVLQFSLSQFNTNNLTKEKYEEFVRLYNSKYQNLRKNKEREADLRRKQLPLSWMDEFYRQQDINQQKIEEQIHQHSVMLSRQVKYHSMHTPIRNRDPQRLTKTMDSVQMLKKKRSTKQKKRPPKNFKEDQEDSENDQEMTSCMMASLPVGRKFEAKKRRVTFSISQSKVEKIRQQEVPPSYIKPDNADLKSKERMEEELQIMSQPNPQ